MAGAEHPRKRGRGRPKKEMNKQRVRDGTTEPDRVPSPDNNSDVGTKCQNDPDYLRLTPRLKGYAESYIPPEYNLLMGPLTDHAFG
eukprot:COSAG01_NODE_707_length_14133_cov_34.324093_9_plen_86_part_00